MYNVPDYYRAEIAYRRERALIDRRPLFVRSRSLLTRHRRHDDGTGKAA